MWPVMWQLASIRVYLSNIHHNACDATFPARRWRLLRRNSHPKIARHCQAATLSCPIFKWFSIAPELSPGT